MKYEVNWQALVSQVLVSDLPLKACCNFLNKKPPYVVIFLKGGCTKFWESRMQFAFYIVERYHFDTK